MTEKLTEEERARILDSTPIAFPGAHYVGKMLRIIDEQAAELDATHREYDRSIKGLKAQLAEARAEIERLTDRLTEQVANGDGWRTGQAAAENRCHALSTSLAEARALLADYRRPESPREAAEDEDTLCSECNEPVQWGSRHAECGRKAMAAEPRAAAERAVLEAAEAFARSWERAGAEPGDDDLGEEHVLFHAVLALRAVKHGG